MEVGGGRGGEDRRLKVGGVGDGGGCDGVGEVELGGEGLEVDGAGSRVGEGEGWWIYFYMYMPLKGADMTISN